MAMRPLLSMFLDSLQYFPLDRRWAARRHVLGMIAKNASVLHHQHPISMADQAWIMADAKHECTMTFCNIVQNIDCDLAVRGIERASGFVGK